MGGQTETEFWSRIEGVPLDGHLLRKWIGEDGNRRYYLGAGGDRQELIAVVRLDSDNASGQLGCWELAATLSHPNLLAVFETGRGEIDGAGLAYAVMERPEDDLASVIQDRPLTAGETREALRAVIAGLQYLHTKGLAHGEIEAGNVVAVGDSIKISCQAVREAGPGGAAGDVRALGPMLSEVLTGGRASGPDGLSGLPAPFPEIIEACRDGSSGLAQISAILDPPRRARAATVAAAAAEPPAARIAVLPQPRVQPIREPSAIGELEPGHFPKWIYAAAAAVIVLGLVALSRKPSPPAQPAEPGVVPVSKPTPEAAPPQPAPQAAKAAPLKAAARTDAADPAVWRVISYTYTRRADAEHMTQSIRRKWPQFQPEVFAPYGPAGAQLVSIGGAMTRDEAQRVQRQAVAGGLPGDTFIRNYPDRHP